MPTEGSVGAGDQLDPVKSAFSQVLRPDHELEDAFAEPVADRLPRGEFQQQQPFFEILLDITLHKAGRSEETIRTRRMKRADFLR